jgi:hypothetical protein
MCGNPAKADKIMNQASKATNRADFLLRAANVKTFAQINNVCLAKDIVERRDGIYKPMS